MPLSITRINAARLMIRQPRESLLSIIPAKKIRPILRRTHLSLSSIKRQEFSCRAVRGAARAKEREKETEREKVREERGKKKKGETGTVTGADGIDKYRVTHYAELCWT